MGKNFMEKALKRALKRRIKITLGLVTAFLISGNIGYADPITRYFGDAGGIEITIGQDPYMGYNIEYDDEEFDFLPKNEYEIADFTRDEKGKEIETQIITGETIKTGITVDKGGTTHGTGWVYGIFTTGGADGTKLGVNDLEVKFNNMKISLEQNPSNNGSIGQVVSGHENGKTITLTGNNLDITLIQKQGTASNTSDDKELTSAIYSKNNGKVVVNTNKTTINVNSNVTGATGADLAGIIADTGGNIAVIRDLDIKVDSLYQGYGILTNKSGTVTLSGETNIITVTGKSDKYLSGIRAEDYKYNSTGSAINLTGKNTTITVKEAEDNNKKLGYAMGVYGARDIKVENHEKFIVDVSSKSGGSEGIYAEGKNTNIDINSKNTVVSSTNTGSGTAYGIHTDGSDGTISDSKEKGGTVTIDGGEALITAKSEKGDSYGIKNTNQGTVEIGGTKAVINASSNSGSAYGVNIGTGGASPKADGSEEIVINSAENIITSEAKGNNTSYAVSILDGTTYNGKKPSITISGKNHIEAKAVKGEARALSAQSKGEVSVKGNSHIKAESENGKTYALSAQNNGEVSIEGTSHIEAKSAKGEAYALSAQNNGEVSIEGTSHIEAKSTKGEAYALYAKDNGIIKVNEDNSDNQVEVIGDIKAEGALFKKENILLNLNGKASSLTGNVTYTSSIAKGVVSLGVSNEAVWNNERDSKVTNLNLDNGIVNMGHEGNRQTIEIDNITGSNGTFVMDISTKDIDQNNSKETDFIKIKNSADKSSQFVQINQSSIEGLSKYDFDNENPNNAIWFADANTNVEFVGKGFDSINNVYNYTLELGTNLRGKGNNGTNWYITGLEKKDSTVTETVIDDLSFLYNSALSRLEVDTLHKRLGEIRNYENAEGIWVRTVAGKQESDVANSGFENNYHMLQVGYDKQKTGEKGNWFTGFAVSRRKSDIDFRNGDGNSENIGLSLYKSFAGNDKTYLDLVARYTYIDTEYKAFNDTSMMKADYDTWAGTLSAEYGKKYSDKNNKWYITPHAQLNYTYIDGESYKTSSDVKVKQDDIDSLIGRVGIYAGKDFKKSSHYVKVSALHEFMGDAGAELKGADTTIYKKIDGKDSWIEAGIGGNFQIGDSGTTHLYYDLERTFESDYETEWQATVGVRISFNDLADLFKGKAPEPKISQTTRMLKSLKADNYFDFDKSELKPEGKAVIKKTAEIINKENLQGTILIEGHTDSKGAEEYNQKLSERRAEAVQNELKNNIEKAENIKYETKGYGESQPIADNTTEEGRAQNRRVEIKYENR